MNVRRILSLGLMMVMLCAAMFVFPSPASAHVTSAAHAMKVSVATASCTDDTCNGQSPVTTGCENDAVTERSATSNDLGGGLRATIHLNFSPTCHAAWAKEEFNKALLSGTIGDAGIVNRNRKDYFCQSPGGNGVVEPMQTTCYTPMLGDGPGEATVVAAFYFPKGANNWQQVAITTSPF